MSKRTDSLIVGAIRAVKGSGGSHKTQYNHMRETRLFVSALRQAGYGVQKWENVTNKHVQEVVSAWQKEGLAASTMKEYLSGVRFGQDSGKTIGSRDLTANSESRTGFTSAIRTRACPWKCTKGSSPP